MSAELQTTLEIIGAGILLRLWSMIEHRKTGKTINEIHVLVNGEVQKKLKAEYERGRQDEKNETLKS